MNNEADYSSPVYLRDLKQEQQDDYIRIWKEEKRTDLIKAIEDEENDDDIIIGYYVKAGDEVVE